MPDDSEPGLTKAELDRQARSWIARVAGRDASQHDRDALFAWRATSPQHEAAYQNALELQRLINEAARDFEVGPAPIFTRRRLLTGGAVAAGAAYVAGTLGHIPTWRSAIADHSTGRGQQAQVTLMQGVVADLDGQSSIDFDQSAGLVSLVEGAAFFRVDNAAPFSVTASTWRLEATKAAFSIQHTAGAIEVGCAAGLVEAYGAVNSEIPTGQLARLDDKAAAMIGQIEPAEVASWRTGSMVFRNRRLEDVVGDINRHRRGRIIILDQALAERRVNGVFKIAQIDSVLDQIAASLSLGVTKLPAGVTLLS